MRELKALRSNAYNLWPAYFKLLSFTTTLIRICQYHPKKLTKSWGT